MDEITFVGLDAHAASTAVAVAEAGLVAPRFIGTVGAKFSELTKALSKPMWASFGMISDSRTRQPRDGTMQCGTQPADISVIHRR